MWRSYTADTLGLGLTWGPSVLVLSGGVSGPAGSAPVTTITTDHTGCFINRVSLNSKAQVVT